MRASRTLSGLLQLYFPIDTIVSAPMTIASGCLKATARTFSSANFLTRSCAGILCVMSSGIFAGSMTKEMPARSKSSRRRGELDAKTIFRDDIVASLTIIANMQTGQYTYQERDERTDF